MKGNQALFENYIAGENLSAEELVYLSDSREVSKADASDSSKMPCIGITLEAATSGQSVSVLLMGSFENLSSHTFSGEGVRLYVSATTPGEISETVPSSDSDIKQSIGISTTTDGLSFGSPVGDDLLLYYDAIVAPAGGDYTSVYDAFNDGNTTVFVRSGTYTETSTIVIPNGGRLEGEGGSIINLSGGARIEVDASGGIEETAGTISVSTDSTTVTGSGTSFTNLSSGDYIRIGSMFFEIDSITNDTSLEVTEPYRGEAASGLSYLAQSMYTGVELRNFITINAVNEAIYLRAVLGLGISGVVTLSGSDDGIEIINSYGIDIQACSSRNNDGNGFTITGCTKVTLEATTHADNNDGYGVLINGDSMAIALSNSFFTNNGIDGISVSGNTDGCKINSCTSARNDQKGFNTDSTTAQTSISTCISEYNGDWGVDWDGDNNLITSSIVSFNGSGGIQGGNDAVISANHIEDNTGNGINLNSGDINNLISSNHIVGNTGTGISVDTADNYITNNRIDDNGAYGINLTGTSSDNIISANKISGNTTADFQDTGTDNEVLDFKEYCFFSEQMDSPNNSDWAVNALAPASADSNNAALTVRLFDDTTEEGVGFKVEIPVRALNIRFQVVHRAETAPGSAQTVVPTIYVREILDNGSVEAWSAGSDMSSLTIPTNENFQYDEEVFTLSSLGLVGGRIAQFELTRNTSSGSDTLTGDWDLFFVRVRFF